MMHHDCVVIPGWGALVAQYSESFYDTSIGGLTKPVRRVGFNAAVSHNDGLLAQSIVRREGVTYDDAVREIERGVDAFARQLATGGELGLGRLGFFHSAGDGRVEFVPFYHEMCNDRYFGLRSVCFTPLADLRRAAESATPAPSTTAAEEHRAAVVRPQWLAGRALRTAASVAVLLGLGVLLTTPVLVDREQQARASLSVPAITAPQRQSLAASVQSEPESVSPAPEATQTAASNLLLDEGGAFYLVVATLSSEAQTQEYLNAHPDLAGRTMVQHGGKHWRVCVARAATATTLYNFKSSLPKAYAGNAWVYQDK